MNKILNNNIITFYYCYYCYKSKMLERERERERERDDMMRKNLLFWLIHHVLTVLSGLINLKVMS